MRWCRPPRASRPGKPNMPGPGRACSPPDPGRAVPDFLLELFSEEIPARMQARGADELARLLGDALAPLAPAGMRRFHGPRRIAYAATLAAEVPASSSVERGPRLGAPEQALAGFLRKHGAARENLREEGGFHVLARSRPA